MCKCILQAEHSSHNISQVLLNVESTFEITKIELLTKQEDGWRKSKPISEKTDNFIVTPLIYAKQKWLLTTGDPKSRSSFVLKFLFAVPPNSPQSDTTLLIILQLCGIVTLPQ